MHEDVIVYDDRTHYVGLIGETWWRWPAERDGWLRRERCDPERSGRCTELPPRQAHLAVRLSGVGAP